MKKRIVSLILSVAMLFSFGVTAFAQDTEAPEGEEFYQGYDLFEYLLEYYLENHVFQPDKEDVLNTVVEYILRSHPELLDEAIYYLMKSSDPYSYYFSKEEYEEYLAPETHFGIGVTVEYGDGYIWVKNVESGGPAYTAGVVEGDIIYSVDGKKVAGMKYEDVTALIRSEEVAPLTMEFYRPAESGGYVYEVTMTRQKIGASSVNWYISESGGKPYGYIQVTSFKSYTTYFMFVAAVNAMQAEGVKDIIVDLRGNLGGSLYVCLDMINWLTPGRRLLCTIHTPSTGEKKDYYSTGRGVELDSVSVLVNSRSASASELFAKSLQDNGIATVIGTQTFGKAIGQTQYEQPDGSVISISNFEVISPKGARYNGIGVTPDIETKLPYTQVPEHSFEYLTFDNYTQAKNQAENDVVYALEQRLVLMGYLKTADRLFDSDTVKALWRFQENNGITPSAVLTKETLVKITDIVNLVKLCGTYRDEAMEKAVELAIN